MVGGRTEPALLRFGLENAEQRRAAWGGEKRAKKAAGKMVKWKIPLILNPSLLIHELFCLCVCLWGFYRDKVFTLGSKSEPFKIWSQGIQTFLSRRRKECVRFCFCAIVKASKPRPLQSVLQSLLTSLATESKTSKLKTEAKVNNFQEMNSNFLYKRARKLWWHLEKDERLIKLLLSNESCEIVSELLLLISTKTFCIKYMRKE